MITADQITKLVEQTIEGTTIYVVDIRVSNGNAIVVEIDDVDGLKIDDCVKVSRHIERSLDRDIEDFKLDVSSPGMGKPFKVRKQYEKNKGKKVRVKQSTGESVEGLLKAVDDVGLELLIVKKVGKGKKQKKIETNKLLPWEEVKSTNIVIDF